MPKTYFQKRGYDFYIAINNVSIARSMITDEIIVDKATGQTSTAQFTLLHGIGVQDPDSYVGKLVTIDVRENTGIKRIFTGIIELPELDLIKKRTTYKCSDNRELIIKNLPDSYVNNIGTYSELILGTYNDKVELLTKRMETIPYYFNLDSYQLPRLTSWTPKATPDHVLGATNVYRREPTVVFTQRNKTVNSVDISFTYEYQRCFQKAISYSWSGYDSLFRWVLDGRPSFPTKEAIKSAADGVGWVVPSISYVNLWPAQGLSIGDGVVLWQPNTLSSQYEVRRDSQGNIVKDASGDTLYREVSHTINDISSHLCRGANWTAYKRWTQNLREAYTLTLYSPQSVARFGENKSIENYTLSSDYSPDTWESAPPDVDFDSDSFINQDTNRPDLNLAFNAAINKAYVALLRVHRDVEVNTQIPIKPSIDIHHTVEIDMYKVECKGIVKRIKHYIDVPSTNAYTELTLELSRMNGSASTSTLTPPSVPSEDLSYNTFITAISLQTLLGEDPANYPNFAGYIGNKWTSGTSLEPSVRTTYPECFIVDSPDITNTLRDTRNLYSTSSYTIAIPNDPLVVRY